MTRIAIVAALAALASGSIADAKCRDGKGRVAKCPPAVSAASAPAPAATPQPLGRGGPGRWQMIPAASEPNSSGGARAWAAWRLDTESGRVDFCTYVTPPSNGTVGEPTGNALSCSSPVDASP